MKGLYFPRPCVLVVPPSTFGTSVSLRKEAGYSNRIDIVTCPSSLDRGQLWQKHEGGGGFLSLQGQKYILVSASLANTWLWGSHLPVLGLGLSSCKNRTIPYASQDCCKMKQYKHARNMQSAIHAVCSNSTFLTISLTTTTRASCLFRKHVVIIQATWREVWWNDCYIVIKHEPLQKTRHSYMLMKGNY